MADDEEDVPALVAVNPIPTPDPAGKFDTDTQRQRVPITVITGRHPITKVHVLAENRHRILGIGQDDTFELHTERATWQEDCCHLEWLVLVLDNSRATLIAATEFGDCMRSGQRYGRSSTNVICSCGH